MEMLQPEMIAQKINQIMAAGIENGSFGDHLDVRFGGYYADRDVFVVIMNPKSWMQNPAGTVHGGICATMADQAMGLIAYGIHGGETIAPTVQMQINFHRPVMPERDVMLQVRIISVSKNLIHLSVDGLCDMGKLCFSATGTFFRT